MGVVRVSSLIALPRIATGAVCYSNSSGWAAAASMRRCMMSKYLGSFSMPMKLRPVCIHAAPVVPDPAVISSTVSPGL